MSDKFVLYDDTKSDEAGYRRKVAVEAALELIRADALGSTSFARGDKLEYNMERLSLYADKIQGALKAGR